MRINNQHGCYQNGLLSFDKEDVEFIPLGDICTIETGKCNARDSVENGQFMFFTTAKEVSRIDNYAWDTDALMIAGNANVGDVKRYSGKFNAYQRTYVLTNFKSIVSFDYLYFYIKSMLKPYLAEKTNNAAMSYIVLSTLECFEVSIPCPDHPEKSLAIQAEIVRILDTFTELTNELTNELNLRKKQYAYYLDKLLSFDNEDVEFLPIGSICSIKTGQSISKEYITGHLGQYPVLNSGRFPLGYVDTFNTENDPIGIASRGSVGLVTWTDGRFYRGNLNYSCTVNDRNHVNPRYLYYYLLYADSDIQALATHQGIPALNASALKTLMVPVPSMDQQNSIVDVLDKFDTLTQSMAEGLPREIQLRRKQYEYYRDRLLNFKNSNN